MADRLSRLPALALVAACALLPLSGCNNAQKEQVATLEDKNQQLSLELEQKNTALESEREARVRLEQENADLKDRLAGTPSETVITETVVMPTDLPAGVTCRVEGNDLIIDVPGDVLFDSGKAALKSTATSTLDSIAASIRKQFPGSNLRVQGFTDTDPIKKSQWSDNWELAFARARSVGKYLEGKGFADGSFSYVSYGDTKPRTTKAQSRRVEIAVVEAGSTGSTGTANAGSSGGSGSIVTGAGSSARNGGN
jgi:chemotaxis protein MotB